MLLRPFELNMIKGSILSEHDISDLQITVAGLSKLFIKFLYKHSTTSADTILTMLITHLKQHYEQPIVLEHLYLVRLVV